MTPDLMESFPSSYKMKIMLIQESFKTSYRINNSSDKHLSILGSVIQIKKYVGF